MARISSVMLRLAYRLAFGVLRIGGILAMTWTRWRINPIEKPETSGGEETVRRNQHTRSGESSTRSSVASSHVTVRPQSVQKESQRGLMHLDFGESRDGLLLVPAAYQVEKPAPLVLSLHGAGGNAHHGLHLLQQVAEERGFLLLAVDSRGSTWDVIRGSYGPDVEFINRALERVLGLYAVDAERVAIGGFSDGASYALSLGISNGELFRHILAFSPGFAAPDTQQGEPRVFISHGTQDRVLDIDRCSRRLVPQLKRARSDLTYREFDGPHTVPPEVIHESMTWFYAAAPSSDS
jgi:phospholipase/carboxylesterase